MFPVVRRDLPSELQLAILGIDAKLRSMSGEHNAELWEKQALSVAPEWEEIRKLAGAAASQLSRFLDMTDL